MNSVNQNSWNRSKTTRLVTLALLSAIILILQFTPLGFIPIPPFNPTTMHIPVIIGAIVLGPTDGAILGLIFGLSSILQATIQLPLTAFLFSPFVPFGSWKSAVIAIVPRVLVGLFAGYTFRFLQRFDKTKFGASAAAAVVGSFTNTILVLGGVYVLFRSEYANQFKVPVSAVFKGLAAIVGTSGVAEAIVAAVISAAVARAVFALRKRIK